MTLLASLLLGIQVLVGAQPVKNAYLACQQIPVTSEEGDVEDGGYMVPTDSRGVIYFSGELNHPYDCVISAEGYYLWVGILTYTEKVHRITIQLRKVGK